MSHGTRSFKKKNRSAFPDRSRSNRQCPPALFEMNYAQNHLDAPRAGFAWAGVLLGWARSHFRKANRARAAVGLEDIKQNPKRDTPVESRPWQRTSRMGNAADRGGIPLLAKCAMSEAPAFRSWKQLWPCKSPHKQYNSGKFRAEKGDSCLNGTRSRGSDLPCRQTL